MPKTVLRPSLEGGAKMRGVARALRKAGRDDLHRELGKAIKAEAQPTLSDLKASARHVKITGLRTDAKRKFVHATREKHLRERIADATRVQFSANKTQSRVRFVVDGTRLGGAKVLPRYIDSGERGATTIGRGKGRAGWRHPIMGNRSRWAVSVGEPWFFPPIRKHLPDFRRRIEQKLDEIATKIEES